ncbi:GntR family transcriptional regulator [Actinomadura physcomitrii]|nr:FCD domain-containing protein [Actinomadura physcomitrii]
MSSTRRDGPCGDLAAENTVDSQSATRLVDQIVARLQEMIFSGEIPPGSPLRQIEVAQRLGVSRTPLREALRILANMGLLTTGTYKRTLEVAVLSHHDLTDASDVRTRLDPIAARSAARHGLDPSVVDALKTHLETMTADDAGSDPRAYIEAHVAFHTLITEHCGSPLLVRMAPLLKLGGYLIRRGFETASARQPDISQNSRAEALREFDIIRHHHRDLFEAIINQDPDKAEVVAEHHSLISRRRGQAMPFVLMSEHDLETQAWDAEEH